MAGIQSSLGNKVESKNGTLKIDISIDPSVFLPKKEDIPEEKKEADDLGLQLTNKDALDKSEEDTLTTDVVLFIRSLLKQNKKDVIKNFISEHKDHLSPIMKDMISDEIKNSKDEEQSV